MASVDPADDPPNLAAAGLPIKPPVGPTVSSCWGALGRRIRRVQEPRAEQGLICKDNLRADIVVAFFVRVNNTVEDVHKVAQSLGCQRASDRQALVELFDAKFSEALKTVGKQFDFSELYTNRVAFR